MKVSYCIVGESLVYTVLFDETAISSGGPVLEAFNPEYHPNPQKEPLAGSQNPFLHPRSSAGWSFTLAYWAEYATRKDALASVRSGDVQVLRSMRNHIKVEQDAEKQYYPNAVCDGYQAELHGCSVLHRFQFTSQDLTDTDPVTP